MGFFKAPKVQTTAAEDVGAEQKKNKMARKALFMTEGGQQGEELQVGQVQKRETLFGN